MLRYILAFASLLTAISEDVASESCQATTPVSFDSATEQPARCKAFIQTRSLELKIQMQTAESDAKQNISESSSRLASNLSMSSNCSDCVHKNTSLQQISKRRKARHHPGRRPHIVPPIHADHVALDEAPDLPIYTEGLSDDDTDNDDILQQEMDHDDSMGDMLPGDLEAEEELGFRNIDSGSFLPMEIHLPHLTMEDLLQKYAGTTSLAMLVSMKSETNSVATLLIVLQNELCKAANISKRRLVITSIHGRFTRPLDLFSAPTSDSNGPILLGSGRRDQPVKKSGSSNLLGVVNGGVPHKMRLGEEVVIAMVVRQAQTGGEASESKVLGDLGAALSNASSILRRGSVGFLLKDAFITVGGQETYDMTDPPVDTWSALALPIAISGAFTAVIIWLATF
jgi:hypothetical protein